MTRPQTLTTTDAVASAGFAMAGHSRDWSTDCRDAWLYGLICGWDCDAAHERGHEHDEECSAMAEVAERHGWTEDDVARLRRLRAVLADV